MFDIAIFTTASVPWMTGTAVNPIFRAAYLANDKKIKVTLAIPWLCLEDQKLVYPNQITFASPLEHKHYVQNWAEERTGFTSLFHILFYPAKFCTEKRSILAIGDITQLIPDEDADVAILEEPEHLTWYHHGKRWKEKFKHVVGIVHTNYLEYVRREKNKQLHAFLLKYINGWVTEIYCHKIIRLSAATQNLPRSVICNVHGVNPKFITIGKLKQNLTQCAYYIGKMVWSKGYRDLHRLLMDNQTQLVNIQLDLYGSGEDSEQVKKAVQDLKLAVNINSGRDHSDPIFHGYKVFINPSTTDVLCTTTAEALAMGKIVVCAKHPSNQFFDHFSNCRMYTNDAEFVKTTLKALSDDPTPLTDKERHELSWEAATERFLRSADLLNSNKFSENAVDCPESSTTNQGSFMALSLRREDLKKKIEDASAFLHFKISGNERMRVFLGALPKSLEPDEELSKELGLVAGGR